MLDKVLDVIILYNAIHPIMHGRVQGAPRSATTDPPWHRRRASARQYKFGRYWLKRYERTQEGATEDFGIKGRSQEHRRRCWSEEGQRLPSQIKKLQTTTDLLHPTLPSRRIVCAIAHGRNTDRRSTVPSRVLRNFSRHDQVTYCFPTHDYHTIGEANFYVVYVDTTSSSAD